MQSLTLSKQHIDNALPPFTDTAFWMILKYFDITPNAENEGFRRLQEKVEFMDDIISLLPANDISTQELFDMVADTASAHGAYPNDQFITVKEDTRDVLEEFKLWRQYHGDMSVQTSRVMFNANLLELSVATILAPKFFALPSTYKHEGFNSYVDYLEIHKTIGTFTTYVDTDEEEVKAEVREALLNVMAEQGVDILDDKNLIEPFKFADYYLDCAMAIRDQLQIVRGAIEAAVNNIPRTE